MERQYHNIGRKDGVPPKQILRHSKQIGMDWAVLGPHQSAKGKIIEYYRGAIVLKGAGENTESDTHSSILYSSTCTMHVPDNVAHHCSLSVELYVNHFKLTTFTGNF